MTMADVQKKAISPKQRDFLTAFGIFVAMVIFGVGYMYFFVWSPEITTNKRTADTAREETKKITMSIREINDKLSDETGIKRKFLYVSRVANMLPSSIDAPGFLNDLASALQVTQIDYTRLSPNEPNQKIGYTELPYNIVCDGRYHDFGQFLNLIEANPKRFMRVKSFDVKMNPDRPSWHPVQLSIGTFFLTRVENKQEQQQD